MDTCEVKGCRRESSVEVCGCHVCQDHYERLCDNDTVFLKRPAKELSLLGGLSDTNDDAANTPKTEVQEAPKPIPISRPAPKTQPLQSIPEGAKKINIEVIRDLEMHALMESIIASFHPHLASANIALAWNLNWKEDKDDHLRLGQCKKCGDIDRDLHGFDFIIILNRDAWNDFDAHQKSALLDHELSHAAVDVDAETGEEKVDERGRPVWRIRKHDVEEFTGIVRRHGLYKSDLETFYAAARERRERPLLKAAE